MTLPPLFLLLALSSPPPELAVDAAQEIVPVTTVTLAAVDEKVTLRTKQKALARARIRRYAEEAHRRNAHVPAVRWYVPWVPLDAREASRQLYFPSAAEHPR